MTSSIWSNQAFRRGLGIVMLFLMVGISGCASLESARSSRFGVSPAREEIYLNQPNLKNLIVERQGKSVTSRRTSKRNSEEHVAAQKRRSDERTLSQQTESRRIPLSPQIPLLEEPKVKSIWVEEQIRGNRFIEGHFEHVIEENAKWSK